jgi:hypothetical protein
VALLFLFLYESLSVGIAGPPDMFADRRGSSSVYAALFLTDHHLASAFKETFFDETRC